MKSDEIILSTICTKVTNLVTVCSGWRLGESRINDPDTKVVTNLREKFHKGLSGALYTFFIVRNKIKVSL